MRPSTTIRFVESVNFTLRGSTHAAINKKPIEISLRIITQNLNPYVIDGTGTPINDI